MASPSCLHALRRSLDTARTRCGRPHRAALNGASAPCCRLTESLEEGRAVLPPLGAVWGGWGYSAGCSTWLKGCGIPCKLEEGLEFGGAALKLRQGVDAGWCCCGGWKGVLGAESLPPGRGKGMQTSCGSPPACAGKRTSSLTPQHPKEMCQGWEGCMVHRRGPQELEDPCSGRAAAKEPGNRARGSQGPDSQRTLCHLQASTGPGGRTRRGPGSRSPAS